MDTSPTFDFFPTTCMSNYSEISVALNISSDQTFLLINLCNYKLRILPVEEVCRVYTLYTPRMRVLQSYFAVPRI